MSFFGGNSQANNNNINSDSNYEPPRVVPKMSTTATAVNSADTATNTGLSASAGSGQNEFDPFASLMNPSTSTQHQHTYNPTTLQASTFSNPADTIMAAYGNSAQPGPSTTTTTSLSSTSTTIDPSLSGMFLGLDSQQPPPPVSNFVTSSNNEDVPLEDRELIQAQEAAMYAQEVLQKQAKEKEKRFGFRPKIPTIPIPKVPKVPTIKWGANTKQTPQMGEGEESPKNYQEEWNSDGNGDITIQVDDDNINDVKRPWFQKQDQENTVSSSDDKDIRPPWLRAKKRNNPESQNNGSSSSNNTNNNSNINDSNKPGTAAAVMGAATLGGVAGFVALGPLAAVVAGAGVAIQTARAKDDSILRGMVIWFFL